MKSLLLALKVCTFNLTLLHLERPKLYIILAFLRAIFIDEPCRAKLLQRFLTFLFQQKMAANIAFC